MRRNLDRRIEAVTPIESSQLKEKIEELLELYLSDNRNAWEMQSNGSFLQVKSKEEIRSAQLELIERTKTSRSKNT